MRMIIATVMLAASGYYLFEEYQTNLLKAPKAVEAPAPVAAAELAPMLDLKQVAALHESINSADRNVRLAAIQTLFTVNDPQIMTVLEGAMARESDPEIRVSIVLLLKTSTDRNAIKILGMGVRDTDPTVRVASLRVISEVGDLTATSVVAEAVNDAEDGVKLQAMSTLSTLQDRRKAQYRELTEQLRHQYEEQVKKTQEKAG